MEDSGSQRLFKRAQKSIPGGVNSPVRAFRSVGGTPFFTVKADGCQLTTADGRELIDFVCTWGPAIHGHNDPQIKNAVAAALESGTSFGTPTPREVYIAEMVIEAVPSLEMVRFCNSGTEATMSSIRLARGYTGRHKIVKFAGCYHGHVDSLLVKAGSGAMTLGNPDSAGVPPAFAAETIILEYNDLDAVRTCFEELGNEIAGIIVEPFPANCGLILPQDGFLQGLRDICSEYGSVLIFDEVMTGFRISLGGVQEKVGVTPDLTAMGKIIGGGLPVGAFGGRREIMEHLSPTGPVYQAGTLSGNPLAMAAGLASIEKLVDNPPYEELEKSGEMITRAITSAAKKKGIPLQVPHAGSMFSLFFTEEPVTNYPQATATHTDLFAKLFHAALDKGVYLPPSSFETCFISTAHDKQSIEQASEVLAQAIEAF